ncbi:50S ribosomal protein L29 [Candidatus Collierbacteria bacterium RIFOXYB1_FULL_49_13]|uniref:Large ribosomal subunit protein uL29 n=1 Tax=Candidatus Collierbacteria bacterium RIFOXYB1_FULL_49_13 TaxID=1817728 RepID=A0A1F5FHR0_9BACT|nr:MAG: 50S ribosomal protein L29 [Candidatus Collierbacteria bacterium RIFOXYB1_FULL_49_13]
MLNTKLTKNNVKSASGGTTKTLIELRAELLKVKLDIKAGKLKNSNAHKQLKLQIARLLTNTAKS